MSESCNCLAFVALTVSWPQGRPLEVGQVGPAAEVKKEFRHGNRLSAVSLLSIAMQGLKLSFFLHYS